MLININNSGFTLVELLGVLVILGIIAIFAVPTISSSLEKQNLKEIERSKQNVLSEFEIKLSTIKKSLEDKEKFNSGNCCVTIQWLLEKKYIKKRILKDIDLDLYNKIGIYKDSVNGELRINDTCNNVCK